MNNNLLSIPGNFREINMAQSLEAQQQAAQLLAALPLSAQAQAQALSNLISAGFLQFPPGPGNEAVEIVVVNCK